MKRTKETFFRYHPEAEQREGMSGCKEFDGEDLEYDARIKYYKDQQKDWVNQQRQELEEKNYREKYEEELYAKQTLEATRMRQMLEENHQQKKSSIQNTMKEENQLLAQQKKEREEREKAERLRWEQEEVRTTIQRGQKKPYVPPQ